MTLREFLKDQGADVDAVLDTVIGDAMSTAAFIGATVESGYAASPPTIKIELLKGRGMGS